MTRKSIFYQNCRSGFSYISLFIVLCLLSAVLLPSCSSRKNRVADDSQKLSLSLKDTVYAREVTPEEGAARLQELLRLYPDLTSWEQRKTCLREGLLAALELNPAPEKNPLVPVYGGHKAFERYTVDNVAFECVPGVWVTGNLYRPVQKQGSIPAILLPHGHGRQEPLDDCPRFSEATQRLAISLAVMGAAVFTYDMFAYGESAYHAGVHAHRTSLTQTIQTWSSLRAVDFLVSLEEVDSRRIGMTGASGGGTQTFLAAALDERIAVSVPVVQISSFFPGGCTCESGRPIHARCGVLSNNAEIAALAAPRPQLVVSDGKDWTRTVDRVEFPYIRTVYGYYGQTEQVENAHFPDEGHDYGYSKRSAACRFFASRLGLDIQAILGNDGTVDETGYTLLPAGELAVFPDKQLPEGALHRMEDIYRAFAGSAFQAVAFKINSQRFEAPPLICAF
jgi:dienelactone hydrolase